MERPIQVWHHTCRTFIKSFLAATGLGILLAHGNDSSKYVDASAHSSTFELYRRAETRSHRLGLTQAFPHDLDTLTKFLATSLPTPFDWERFKNAEVGQHKERIRWSDGLRGHSIYFRPEFQLAGNLSDDSLGNRYLSGVGMTLYGSVLRDVGFYSHGLVFTESASKGRFTHQFNPEFGEVYSAEVTSENPLAKSRTYNRFEYYLKYQKDLLTIKAGRDWFHFGPGYFSSLSASRETPPYSLLEVRLDFAPWLFMDNYLFRMVDTEFEIQKYGQIHRFEFKPAGNLSLGFTDIVIYQDRDPDPKYFLPLAPLAFSEINNGGLDNSAMAFDFMWTTPWFVSLWGEIFVDDLVGPGSFFDSWWENRWAALCGAQWVSPWNQIDADIVLEYSQVEPWSYNGRQPQTSFKHFNVPSASKLGPDSRSFDVQIAWRPLKWMELKERFEWNQKGSERPATLGVVHDDRIDGTSKALLNGDIATEYVTKHSVAAHYQKWVTLEGYWIIDRGDKKETNLGVMVQVHY
jgi:hypothetical protein